MDERKIRENEAMFFAKKIARLAAEDGLTVAEFRAAVYYAKKIANDTKIKVSE